MIRNDKKESKKRIHIISNKNLREIFEIGIINQCINIKSAKLNY